MSFFEKFLSTSIIGLCVGFGAALIYNAFSFGKATAILGGVLGVIITVLMITYFPGRQTGAKRAGSGMVWVEMNETDEGGK